MYSIDFIEKAVAYRQKGHSFEELRDAFGIPSATYYDWAEKLENGHYDVKIKRERHRKIDKKALEKAVAETPDAFLKEHAKLFNCTPTAIHYALEKLNITRKKRHIPIMKNLNRSARNMPQKQT
jgi:transposase